MKHTAKYWKYIGDRNATDKMCNNSYGYSLEVLKYLHNNAGKSGFTDVNVKMTNKNEFGQTIDGGFAVTISAPKEVWEQALIEVNKTKAEDVESKLKAGHIKLTSDGIYNNFTWDDNKTQVFDYPFPDKDDDEDKDDEDDENVDDNMITVLKQGYTIFTYKEKKYCFQ